MAFGTSLSPQLLLLVLAVCGSCHGMGVTITSNTDTVKNEGDYITLTCAVADLTGVTEVVWHKHGGDLPHHRHFVYPPHPHTTNYLLLYNLKFHDTGMYTCSANRGASGGDSATVQVTVVSSEPVTPCVSQPCQNEGTCMDIPQLHTFACMCKAGFRGVTCENRVTVPTTPAAPPTTTPPPVTTVMPCSSSPCKNGGMCRNDGDYFSCTCAASYTGPTCEIVDNCAPNPCSNNGICANVASSHADGNMTCNTAVRQYNCMCAEGFTGPTCSQRDHCGSSPCFNGATCVNVDDTTYDCVCMDGYVGDRCERMPFEGCGKYGQFMKPRELRDFFYTETIRSSPPAADIIFVVDESGSMVTEHRWLEQVSSALDTSLQNNQIGVDMPNQFGLVGFARDNKMDITGRIIHMDNGCQFGQASHFRRATSRLALNGRLEDLYLGIILALDHYQFRPGTACQIIGVTDEGRYPLPPSANHRDGGNAPYEYEYMLRRLNESRCVLNVVVNQQMESAGKPGLGVGSKGEGYAETSEGNFRVDPGKGKAVPDTGHGTTHKDYTRLALASHGGSWDLNRLRQGGETAKAFTKAFVHLKQREINRQLCERCTCDQGPVAYCRAGCLGEPPQQVVVASVYEQLTEAAVNEGGSALFECQAAGDPQPTCTWTKPDGSRLPTSARYLGENNCTLMLPGVSSINCVQCIAENIEGSMESSVQCVDYAAQCEMKDGRKVFHGSSARNYSEIKVEDLASIPFSSAMVVMIVDESRSMIGEHRWLRTTLPALEKNLLARGVGTQGRTNQYALVGFASPRYNRLGRIINLAPGRDCGTAEEVSTAMKNLRQDGRKEDGYAAIGMAFDNLSCLQGKRGNTTALQVILVTDEDRDTLKKSWTYETVRQAIVRRGGILNVVVKNQFEGKDENMKTVRAMGIDRRQRAVIVNEAKDGFYFLPHGVATKDSGHGTTERDYVDLATHTGGGAWDLTMLRDGTYREAFTQGFIAAKVEEIQIQLLGRCEECFCQNGTTACNVLSNVKTEEGCMNPVPNAELRVSILGEASAVAGDFSKLECVAEGPADQGQPAVIWDPHPVSALQINDFDNHHYDLEFAATLEQDARPYRCIGRNDQGQSAAAVEFNVAPSATNPYKGVIFGSSSGVNARFSEAGGFLPVEETKGENTICLHTKHTRHNKIPTMRMSHAKLFKDLEIRCEGPHSNVEFGRVVRNSRFDREHTVQYGFGLPQGVYVQNGISMKFNLNTLTDGEFELSCRHVGSKKTANCDNHRCLKIKVYNRKVLILPKRQLCRFN